MAPDRAKRIQIQADRPNHPITNSYIVEIQKNWRYLDGKRLEFRSTFRPRAIDQMKYAVDACVSGKIVMYTLSKVT